MRQHLAWSATFPSALRSRRPNARLSGAIARKQRYRFDPNALRVRSAMYDRVVHPSKDGDATLSGKPRNTTHFLCPFDATLAIRSTALLAKHVSRIAAGITIPAIEHQTAPRLVQQVIAGQDDVYASLI